MDFDAVMNFVESLPLDWVIIAGFAVLLAFDTLRSGAGRVAALAMALPGAMLLASVFPQAAFVGTLSEQLATPLLQGVLFLIFATALFLLIRRMDPLYGSEAGQPVSALLAAGGGTAILVVVWLQVPALAAVWQFSDSVATVFGNPYAFWWLIGSFATIAFVRS